MKDYSELPDCNNSADVGSTGQPVAHITGYHDGRCVIEPADRATVLPVGMALYRQQDSSAAQVVPAAMTITLERTLGARGEAFDPPGPRRAYTYQYQPGNIGASRLGAAWFACVSHPKSDSIDCGLLLLKELERQGFGVFQIEVSDALKTDQQEQK